MPLSVIFEGKVLDFKFKQQKHQPYIYNFYLTDKEDIFMGQLFKMKTGWTALSNKPHPMNNVPGFKTRIDAAEYVLRLQGYRNT